MILLSADQRPLRAIAMTHPAPSMAAFALAALTLLVVGLSTLQLSPGLVLALARLATPTGQAPALSHQPTTQAAKAAPPAPAQPFVLKAHSPAERERAVRCLANAIYYEAALEPLDGQRAVAQVVLNRLRDRNFPKSICGVVYEGWERPTGCQFSFTCNGALIHHPLPQLFAETRKVAEAALNGYVMTEVGVATHYHADYVSPAWAPTLIKIGQIGAHIFYRWHGHAGLPAAFTGAYAGGETRLSEAVLTGRGRVKAFAQRTVAMLRNHGRGHAPARLAAAAAPPLYGRRQGTPQEIARINAILEQRFPTAPAATPAAASTSEAPSAPAAG